MISKMFKHYTSIMSKWLNGLSLIQKQSRLKENIILVDTERKLGKLVGHLEKEHELALDTEGNSLYSYHAKVCLIQISTRKKHYIIDPIKIKEISCLKKILSNPNIEKILHGSAYDIQMLYQCSGIHIRNLFDTQIAASFLGESKPGLACLVKKYFGVHLSKVHQKSNWAIRPLPDEMLEYAILDTVYLLPLADRLREELTLKERMEWVKEECEYLAKFGKEIKKKNRSPFSNRQISDSKLPIAAAIMRFREDLARKMDLPPFRVMDKKTILDIAGSRNLDMKELKRITSKSPIIQKHLEEIFEIIRKAGKNSAGVKHAQQICKKRSDRKFRGKTEKLYIFRNRMAEQLKIEPYLVLSQKQILTLAEAKVTTANDILDIKCLKNWQKELFGKELCEILKKVMTPIH
ncbi:MAG: HRDC domain-containing protein [Candidatus Omnitrophica bacterium]|nr:HRDC domain-containing protein [Candidatus Omnitrophota bacterium]